MLNFKNELVTQLKDFKSNFIVIISKYFEKESNELYSLCDCLIEEANKNFQLNDNKHLNSIEFVNSDIVLLKIQQIFKTINSKLDISYKLSKRLIDLVKELIQILARIDFNTVFYYLIDYRHYKNNFVFRFIIIFLNSYFFYQIIIMIRLKMFKTLIF